jgi:predicted ATPase
MSRIVITGGPGVGKTTLVLALKARGYTIVGDSPRSIIQDRRRRGLSPRPNAYEFAHGTLRMDIENLFITLRLRATSSLIEASSMLFADSIASHP